MAGIRGNFCIYFITSLQVWCILLFSIKAFHNPRSVDLAVRLYLCTKEWGEHVASSLATIFTATVWRCPWNVQGHHRCEEKAQFEQALWICTAGSKHCVQLTCKAHHPVISIYNYPGRTSAWGSKIALQSCRTDTKISSQCILLCMSCANVI